MKVLIIDRSKWLRGGMRSKLRDTSGRMCCLGFDALARGVKASLLVGVDVPIGVARRGVQSEYVSDRKLFRSSHGSRIHTTAVEDAIGINDDSLITDSTREAELIPILKQLGWDDVQFIDGAS